MKVRHVILVTVVVALFLGVGIAGLIAFALKGGKGSHLNQGDFVGLVRLEDEIGSSLGVLEEFRKLKDEGAKGIVLRIDSPGGSVAASQEIYEAVYQLRQDSIPVVVTMGNVAASGGLYSSLSAEKIFANPGTVTGSIGVISQFPEAKELFDKLGVHMTTIKSGANKDLGNPFKKADSGQIQVMHELIMNAYEQFVHAILKSRPKVKEDELRPMADGRVMTGEQAFELGIVDTLGTYDDAVRWIKQRTGLPEDAEVKEKRPEKPILSQILAEPANELREAIQPRNKGLWYVYQP